MGASMPDGTRNRMRKKFHPHPPRRTNPCWDPLHVVLSCYTWLLKFAFENTEKNMELMVQVQKDQSNNWRGNSNNRRSSSRCVLRNNGGWCRWGYRAISWAGSIGAIEIVTADGNGFVSGTTTTTFTSHPDLDWKQVNQPHTKVHIFTHTTLWAPFSSALVPWKPQW